MDRTLFIHLFRNSKQVNVECAENMGMKQALSILKDVGTSNIYPVIYISIGSQLRAELVLN